jgi:hypothetical protein
MAHVLAWEPCAGRAARSAKLGWRFAHLEAPIRPLHERALFFAVNR